MVFTVISCPEAQQRSSEVQVGHRLQEFEQGPQEASLGLREFFTAVETHRSEGQVLCLFHAISGYHQIRVNAESSKLLNVVTQLGNYRFTVLGQGICSSQDLFNFITDGGTKLDEDFNCLKNIDDFLLFFRNSPGPRGTN